MKYQRKFGSMGHAEPRPVAIGAGRGNELMTSIVYHRPSGQATTRKPFYHHRDIVVRQELSTAYRY